MISPSVVLTALNDYEPAAVKAAVENIFTQLNRHNDTAVNIARGDRVLLKPNLIAPKPAGSGAVTDPAVIVAVAKTVLDMGAKPFIADSPAWGTTAKCIKLFGISQELVKLGVPVIQLDNPKRIRIASAHIGISRVALDADKIINLPKFKSHQQLGATFAIKNMYGCVCGKEKAFWHMARGRSYDKFCKIIASIYQLMNPVLTIVDGITVMEGMGPLSGTPKHLGALIASTDPVACERVCAELVNFVPDQLPVLKMAIQMNMGCGELEKINIIGDSIENLKSLDFEPAQQTALHFSFPRVCRSISKQLVLKVKEALKDRKD